MMRQFLLSVMLMPVAASSQPATNALPGTSGPASGPTVGPASPAWTQKSGKELAAECHSGDAVKHASCTAYITGIYDLQFAPTPPPGVCPPANLNPDNLAAVVTAYIDTHEDGPATAAIAQSIVRFFPCAAQEPRRR
jgi:Rap1a immunity proteins